MKGQSWSVVEIAMLKQGKEPKHRSAAAIRCMRNRLGLGTRKPKPEVSAATTLLRMGIIPGGWTLQKAVRKARQEGIRFVPKYTMTPVTIDDIASLV